VSGSEHSSIDVSNELKIVLADNRRSFRPGETLQGVAVWRLDEPPKSIELRLFWFTRGKGTEDVGVVNKVRFDAPQLTEGRDFSFTLPAGPFSFSGELISLVWALELVVEPGDCSTRVELVISPSGEEILLHPHARA
jgi:hypothetical protein